MLLSLLDVNFIGHKPHLLRSLADIVGTFLLETLAVDLAI